ncbi:MAG: hypothetical protein [Caudoviricetes sp.]|nr:MAG: hypothetical protein [Caudoviricetes sp.]
MTILTQNQTMTSLEIADLVGKRHDNVKRLIETLSSETDKRDAVIVRPHCEDEQFKDAMGRFRTTQTYIFSGEQGKRDSIIIVAQLSPEFTASIVDRWQYLEKKIAGKISKKLARDSTKIEYKPMTDAIALDHGEIKPYHFSNEADMINRIIIGTTSSKFRKENEIGENEAIRDYMTEKQLDAFLTLQRANTVYIEDGIDFQSRKAKLQSLFDRKHSQVLIEEVHLMNQ